MSITLRDVAKAAGLSTATASRVINGYDQVSEKARTRVWKAVESLGYDVPSQRKVSNVSGTIAILIPDVTSSFYTELLSGAEEVAYHRGFHLVVYTTDQRNLQDVMERVRELHHVEGLIMVTPRQEEEKNLKQHKPVVVVDYGNEGSTFPHVTIDNLRAGYAATRYLIDAGHRHIGVLTGPLEVQSALKRLRGFRLALDEAGLELQSEWIFEGDFAETGGYQGVKAIIDRPGPRPTALFCGNDQMGVGALKALNELGISVPEEMALIAFDNQPISEIISPGLTTIAQPMKELGETAVRILLRLVAGEELEVNRIVLDTKLIVRQSS